MVHASMLGTVAVTLGLLVAQQSPEDPVMKARAQRVQAGDAQDLPPVPRTVLEPPPLPPPEVHIKDTPGYRAKKQVRKAKKGKAVAAKKGKKGKTAGKNETVREAKEPKTSKAVKAPKGTKTAKASKEAKAGKASRSKKASRKK